MTRAEELKIGTQIIYVPNHAKDENDPVCEYGFVTQITPRGAFCRYWSKADSRILRTTFCSEHTPFPNLVIKNTHLQSEVDVSLKAHGYTK